MISCSRKGSQGNTTAAILRKAFKGYEQYQELLQFDLVRRDSHEADEDGVIRPIIDESYQNEPLYKLWHILYSIEDRADMYRALVGQLGIKREDLDDGLMDALYKIDFVKQGYGNKSANSSVSSFLTSRRVRCIARLPRLLEYDTPIV